ncbi:MAG: DUF302 domain-containing protein [Burkholderiales bacterium]|nr:DUF302 domain-containing protein [Burkholderiales bacterium]
MRLKLYVFFIISCSLTFSPNGLHASDLKKLVEVVTIKSTFEDVKERVIFAVESQGLVVDHTSDVGGMLARTGKDLGESQVIYGDAVVLEFCSALYSRRMAKFSPDLLAFCPYAISVYTLYGQPETTFVVFKRIARGVTNKETREVLQQIDDLLMVIVEEAAL